MLEKPAPLPGITSQMIKTPRLEMHVLTSGPADGAPVVFLHGNFSAALYFEETMLALPAGYRGIAPDLRGYGWTERKTIDSTRGNREWSDDLFSLLQTMGVAKAHLVGWSMGAGIIYRFIADHSEMVHSATLICPVSPYGFGGSKGPEGLPLFEDHAGSGGGVVNAEFVRRISVADRSADDPNSPRNIINAFYYVAPFRAAREEDFLTASLMEQTGADAYPGDFVPSANWPNVAPGKLGPVNCWSLKYIAGDVPDLLAAPAKPPVLWVRGSNDLIVSDGSFFDIANLGKLGYVPGWPGDEVAPPQPMLQQTRSVLEKYTAAGGSFVEHVIANAGHGPHIEKPEEFNALFHAFLQKA
ncbi:MAG TPA: alpha/beta hydrolase [Anaerolineaceae bacterium]|nr:alpha/beta hydrolase [Anaerolineaceae bacterium]HPN53229.1 alpha/beta hydrolase [Anaerolineaceae bacterium]